VFTKEWPDYSVYSAEHTSELLVDSSLNVMAHGDAGRGSEGETGEWVG